MTKVRADWSDYRENIERNDWIQSNEEVKKRKSELALQARVLRLEELMDKLLKEINIDEDGDGRNINQR